VAAQSRSSRRLLSLRPKGACRRTRDHPQRRIHRSESKIHTGAAMTMTDFTWQGMLAPAA
jgi:hypothetical protein